MFEEKVNEYISCICYSNTCIHMCLIVSCRKSNLWFLLLNRWFVLEIINWTLHGSEGENYDNEVLPTENENEQMILQMIAVYYPKNELPSTDAKMFWRIYIFASYWQTETAT